MGSLMSSLHRFVSEVQRRDLLRAGLTYAVGAWFVIQIADVMSEIFDLPASVVSGLVVVLSIGLLPFLLYKWFSAPPRSSEDDAELSAGFANLFDRRIDFIIISLLVGALSLSLYANFRTPDKAPEEVSILIADFDNRTSNALYTGVLEETLRVGIEVAPFVSSFPRATASSIAAGLPNGKDGLDIDLARIVALREGIDLVVGGSIARTGNQLELRVSAFAPGEKEPLIALIETADNDTEILTAIADVSRQMRIELGDTDKPDGSGQAESFTVANLEAASEYLKAQSLQLDRKLEEAVVHYQRALEYDPEFTRAYAGLALTEQYLGRMEDSARHWQEALSRLQSLTTRGRLRTLGVYFLINQRDYPKALETFEQLVERFPADNVALNNLAVAAFYSMNFERALEVGREVAVLYPDQSGYRANLALYAMYAGHFADAQAVSRDVIEDDPGNVYAYTVLALTSAVEGDIDATRAAYQTMATLDEYGRALAPEGLADLMLHDNDASGAIAILDEAIAAATAAGANHSIALKQIIRAEALVALEQVDLARDALQQGIENANGDPAVLVPAALQLTAMGELARATDIADDLADSLSISKLAYAGIIRARVADAQADGDRALQLADEALSTADLWLVRFVRAGIRLRNGLIDDARSDLENCRHRTGEAIAAFLNDRPSFRNLRALADLEAQAEMQTAVAMLQ